MKNKFWTHKKRKKSHKKENALVRECVYIRKINSQNLFLPPQLSNRPLQPIGIPMALKHVQTSNNWGAPCLKLHLNNTFCWDTVLNLWYNSSLRCPLRPALRPVWSPIVAFWKRGYSLPTAAFLQTWLKVHIYIYIYIFFFLRTILVSTQIYTYIYISFLRTILVCT